VGTLKMSVTTPTLKPEDKIELSEEDFIKYFRTAFKGHFIGTGQEFYLQLNVSKNLP